MNEPLDGNVLAGPLSALFAAEVTTASASCAGCGRTGVLATAVVYGAPLGLILRCPGCGNAMLRYAETPAGITIDMRGIASLQFAAGGR